MKLHFPPQSPNPNPNYEPPHGHPDHRYIPPALAHKMTNAEWLESMPDEEFVNLLDAVKYEEIRRQRAGHNLRHPHLLTWLKEEHK